MIDIPSFALAFAAGLVSFLSPCCLPLVPGYLATVAGVPSNDVGKRVDPKVIGRSLVFVAAFSLVFVLLGLSATAIGHVLFTNQMLLNKVAGVAIIAMGLLFIGSVYITRLNRDWRPGALVNRTGRGGPAVAGVTFAVAWTPCVGPTLGAILGLAATQTGTAEGGLLLATYSAGLGVPFVLSAAGFSTATRSFTFFKRHYGAMQMTSGGVLIVMGVLVLSGELFRLNVEIQRFLDGFGLNFFQSV